ncbi:ShK domain-like family protein [Brugia pahangi]
MAQDKNEKMAKNISNELSQKNVSGQMSRAMSKAKTEMSQEDVAKQMSRAMSKAKTEMSQEDVDKQMSRVMSKELTQMGQEDVDEQMGRAMSKESAQKMNKVLTKEANEESKADATNILTSELCYDSALPGRESDCTKYGYLCDNILYYNLMTWQCPVTCDRCSDLITSSPRTGKLTNGTCVDLKGSNGHSDCRRYAMLCRDPRYASLMATECPKTCKYCSEH